MNELEIVDGKLECAIMFVVSDVKVGSEAINMGFKARSYIEEIIITIHTNYLNYQGQVK